MGRYAPKIFRAACSACNLAAGRERKKVRHISLNSTEIQMGGVLGLYVISMNIFIVAAGCIAHEGIEHNGTAAVSIVSGFVFWFAGFWMEPGGIRKKNS